jgi:hypothetical protein
MDQANDFEAEKTTNKINPARVSIAPPCPETIYFKSLSGNCKVE